MRFAVIGHPVAHSRSPEIHQAFARQFGIALEYGKIDVAPEGFAEALKRLHAEGYRGFNVTLPHKRAAFEACAERTARAELAGAVNTLIRAGAGWRGDNTDGAGLVRDLTVNLELELTGAKLLVLGAGGSVRGILEPLLGKKPAEVVVSGRTPWKAEEIARAFASHGPVRPCTHAALKGDAFDLVVNATSAGHEGQVPRLPPGLLRPGAACYDLSYGKAFEPFRAWAQSQGAARVADGLGMLVEQAAETFEVWHGRRPRTADVIRSLGSG